MSPGLLGALMRYVHTVPLQSIEQQADIYGDACLSFFSAASHKTTDAVSQTTR